MSRKGRTGGGGRVDPQGRTGGGGQVDPKGRTGGGGWVHPRVHNNKSVQLPYGIHYHHLGSAISCEVVALFPGPHATFGCTKERGGPGMFPHMRDVKGRKVVERTWANWGSEQQESKGMR